MIKRNLNINYGWILVLFVSACTSNASQRATNTTGNGTSSVDTANELKIIYIQAIGDFLKASKQKNKISYDTLFFGKHIYGQPDDFPDITLPENIENTVIRLISPEKGIELQKEKKSRTYINMSGWVEKEKAEFVFVTFSNGGKHQFDCFINYSFDQVSHFFVQSRLRFEEYIFDRDDQLIRIALWENGKYMGDKDINRK